MNLSNNVTTSTATGVVNFLDSEHVRYITGGLTIDRTTVTEDSSGYRYLKGGTIVCEITATKKYGPFDAGATDGRQTAAIGKCFIIPKEVDCTFQDAQSGGIDMARVLTARLPIQPTTEIKAALPLVTWN